MNQSGVVIRSAAISIGPFSQPPSSSTPTTAAQTPSSTSTGGSSRAVRDRRNSP
jgi:hypothetical protein